MANSHDSANILSERQCRQCPNRLPICDRRGRKQLYCSKRCKNAYERRQPERLLTKSRPHEWFSPPEIVEAARLVMGRIDLDPASCDAANLIVGADNYYTKKKDGLTHPWFGRMWINPPYGLLAPKFGVRFAQLFVQGEIEQAILLLAAHHLNTRWFTAIAALRPIACMPPRRLRFSNSTKEPAHGSVILGVGVDAGLFAETFSAFGEIWRRAAPGAAAE